MYGFYSIFFVFVASFIHYLLFSYNQESYMTTDILLAKHLLTQQYEVYAHCVDKNAMNIDPLGHVKVTSFSQISFVVMFDNNPLLQCQEITYSLDFNQIKSKTPKISFENIPKLEVFKQRTKITKLEKGNHLKIDNQKSFLLLLTVKQTKDIIQEPKRMTVQIQKGEFLQNITNSTFWLSFFNLIGISVISYYRKNVFNPKVYIFTSVSILVYLIWISLTSIKSFNDFERYIKLAMTLYVLLACIKTHLSLTQTLIVVCLSAINQVCLELDLSSQVYWFIFCVNLVNLYTIAVGQNIEVVRFSIYSFMVGYGLVNKLVDISSSFVLNLIVISLVFGPTIYQLLQIREDFSKQSKKTQQRLYSYEVSENDKLFKHRSQKQQQIQN